MDAYFIGLIIAIIIAIVIIFKLFKKVIHALFVVLVFLLLMLVAIGAIVYADYNYYTKQNSYNIKVVYVSNDNYMFGASVPMNRGGGYDTSKNLTPLTSEELSSLKSNKGKLSDGEILVEVDEKAFKKLIAQKQTYDINGMKLDSDDVAVIIDSANDDEVLAEILTKNNGLDNSKSSQEIMNELKKNHVEIKESLMLFVMLEATKSKEGLVVLVDSFKNGDISIYPERLSVKLFKSVLPTEFITEKISTAGNSSED